MPGCADGDRADCHALRTVFVVRWHTGHVCEFSQFVSRLPLRGTLIERAAAADNRLTGLRRSTCV